MNIKQNFTSKFIIQRIFFAIILVGIAFFMIFNFKTSDEYDYVLVFMAASFFLAGTFLFYQVLPKTETMKIIDQFANRIHLGLWFVVGIFCLASVFIAKTIMANNQIDWVKLLIFVAFVFVVGRILYNQFFKK